MGAGVRSFESHDEIHAGRDRDHIRRDFLDYSVTNHHFLDYLRLLRAGSSENIQEPASCCNLWFK